MINIFGSKTVRKMTKPIARFVYNLGLQDSEGFHFGSWVVTNFLSNILPPERHWRYRPQFWLCCKLLPILNPARMGKKRAKPTNQATS